MLTLARAALARVEALHLAAARLDRLSTGEARRVLIARALVHTPELMVLDEPTTGLDIVARHRFMEHVRNIARDEHDHPAGDAAHRRDLPGDRPGDPV